MIHCLNEIQITISRKKKIRNKNQSNTNRRRGSKHAFVKQAKKKLKKKLEKIRSKRN